MIGIVPETVSAEGVHVDHHVMMQRIREFDRAVQWPVPRVVSLYCLPGLRFPFRHVSALMASGIVPCVFFWPDAEPGAETGETAVPVSHHGSGAIASGSIDQDLRDWKSQIGELREQQETLGLEFRLIIGFDEPSGFLWHWEGADAFKRMVAHVVQEVDLPGVEFLSRHGTGWPDDNEFRNRKAFFWVPEHGMDWVGLNVGQAGREDGSLETGEETYLRLVAEMVGVGSRSPSSEWMVGLGYGQARWMKQLVAALRLDTRWKWFDIWDWGGAARGEARALKLLRCPVLGRFGL